MEENILRQLVWTDYRLAVLLMLAIPLGLLIWGLLKKSVAITRLMIIYWRVASLLMITLYLMIPGWSVGFLSGFLAKILIPISLWFWLDLNEEIRDLPSTVLKTCVNSWRWSVTVYSALGAILTIPFLSCALGGAKIKTPFCQIWLEAPWAFKEKFHAEASPGFLGFLGAVGLVIYLLYFTYFVVVRLVKQGRSALEQ